MGVGLFLDELIELVEKSWNVPFGGGRSVIDANKVHELVEKIKNELPGELNQARAIVKDRAQIIKEAKEEAESIVNAAKEKAHVLVSQSELVRQAEDRANEIMLSANLKSKNLKKAANDYVDRVLKDTDNLILKTLVDFRNARKNIRVSHQNDK